MSQELGNLRRNLRTQNFLACLVGPSDFDHDFASRCGRRYRFLVMPANSQRTRITSLRYLITQRRRTRIRESIERRCILGYPARNHLWKSKVEYGRYIFAFGWPVIRYRNCKIRGQSIG